MLERLKTEFERYFMLDIAPPRGMISSLISYGISYGISVGTKNRDTFSEIVKDSVYLSNLPKRSPFSGTDQTRLEEKEESALVVSCLDLPELAESNLLLEPEAKKIKYHVLAMQDVTAVVGSIDHIYDTLKLMSTFADKQKPIHIHCYSGVGRSAMMTALHIAHRYLLGDAVIKECIDSGVKLDATSDTFIKDLYAATSKYVFSKRNCCQFDSPQRNDLAISVLTELQKQIIAKQASEPRDENYQFLMAFVQSPEYKKLHHYFYHSPLFQYLSAQTTASPTDPKYIIKQFLNTVLSNQDGWHQQLVDAVNNKQLENGETNSLCQFCNTPFNGNAEEKQSSSADERRALLAGILERIHKLAEQYPNALHGAQAKAYRASVAEKQQQLSHTM